MADFSLADIAAVGSKTGSGLGMAGALGIGALAGLFFGSAVNGGGLFGNHGGWGNGYGAGFANAIGYENLATSNEVQRGFDNQNSMANQREILAAVNAGTSQTVAATNNTFHDTINVLQDKYNEITRDIAAVQVAQAQALANQNQCCCDTKMLIQETSAQNRYDALKNTNDINAVTIGQTQKILDAMAQNKIEALQGRINQLELAQATNNVLRYPNSWTYNAGMSPFCGGNSCGCGF